MGNGVGALRLVEGKLPEKYFRTVMWPKIEELFEKLDMDEERGLKVFFAYCAMDLDETATVDVDECNKFFGGHPSKYTERVFYHPDPNSGARGMDFKKFAIIAWDYCSLTIPQLAQHVFEIYDIEQYGSLEKADIESIYKMLYDCDDHDERYVSEYPFDENQLITKQNFMEHSNKKRHVIQPAIDWQRRIRKKLGGVMMWDSICSFRSRQFRVYDTEANTLEEALVGILASEDLNRRRKREEADRLLEEQNKKLREEAEKAEKELQERERFLEAERRRQEMNAPDREMKKAWKELSDARSAFDDEEYLVDDIWARREAREKLFVLIDKAMAISRDYFGAQDNKTMQLTIGTPDDHEARYLDYIKTEDGSMHYRRSLLMHILKILTDRFEAKRASKKKSSYDTRSESELFVENCRKEVSKHIDDCNEHYAKLALLKNSKEQENTRRVPFKFKPFDHEFEKIKSLCGKKDIFEAEKRAHDELYTFHREKVIAEVTQELEKEKIERERDLARKEFDIVTNCGSRITRWEYLRDKANDRMCYVNVDTLEVMHAKSAICEKCDAIFEQSELKCKKCDAPRSTKNMKLFRPLGFKDIRVD